MFNDSKYTRIYFLIISRAKLRDYGKEIHHIIPRSMGGCDDPKNLVKLTLREHFVVHRLLTKMPIKSAHRWKMHYALSCFMTRKSKLSSRQFEVAKKSAKLVDRTGNGKGRKVSQETKDKLRAKNLGKTQSIETRTKKSQTIKERIANGTIKKPTPKSSEVLRERYFSLNMGEKMSQARKSSKTWRESVSTESSREKRRLNSPKSKPVIFDGIKYNSIRHAAKSLGISYSSLRLKLLHHQEINPQLASIHPLES